MHKVRLRAPSPRQKANGCSIGGKAKRISLSLDDHIFDLIAKQAELCGESFSQTARKFLNLGIGVKNETT